MKYHLPLERPLTCSDHLLAPPVGAAPGDHTIKHLTRCKQTSSLLIPMSIMLQHVVMIVRRDVIVRVSERRRVCGVGGGGGVTIMSVV